MATGDGSGMKVWWDGRHRYVKRLNFHFAYFVHWFPPFSIFLRSNDAQPIFDTSTSNPSKTWKKIIKHGRNPWFWKSLDSPFRIPSRLSRMEKFVVEICLFSSIYIYIYIRLECFPSGKGKFDYRWYRELHLREVNFIWRLIESRLETGSCNNRRVGSVVVIIIGHKSAEKRYINILIYYTWKVGS